LPAWSVCLLVAVVVASGCVQAGAQPTAPRPNTTGDPGAEPPASAIVDEPVTEPHSTAFGSPHPLGGTCSNTMTADRCQAMALHAAQELGVPFDAIASIDVVADPSPDPMDRAHRVFLSIALLDGSTHDVTVSCPGIAGAFDPPCMTDPAVSLGFAGGAEGHSGYTDYPENATPFPSLDPVALGSARALRIASLPIAIAATGPQTLTVGTAGLPNGYLAEAMFGMVDPWPSNVLFNGSIRLEVRPTGGGDPLWNLYEHGWHAGVEEVQATITFDVAWFEPGATIELVDLVVR
jgi:hypothetical protein